MRRLVDFPQARQAPESLIRRLREVDETAELVYLGPDTWALGTVRPNQVQRRAAQTILSNMLTAGRAERSSVAYALLALQGFRQVALYRMREPDGRIAIDFQRRDWAWRHKAEATVHAALLESERSDVGERMAQDVVERNREAWRWAFKRPVSRSVLTNIS